MTVRGWQNASTCRTGFQRHHLIPVALANRAQFSGMFGALATEGLRLGRFIENGLHLPAHEGAASALGHALHRGPHPAYTDVVAARIEAIRVTSSLDHCRGQWEAIARIHTLQRALRRALTDRHSHFLWLNRRDPMRIFADRSYLDDAINALFDPD